MNKTLQETRYNKHAKKHTFVIRMYRGKNRNEAKAYMRVLNKLYVFCEDGEWRKVTYKHDSALKAWVMRVFGI